MRIIPCSSLTSPAMEFSPGKMLPVGTWAAGTHWMTAVVSTGKTNVRRAVRTSTNWSSRSISLGGSPQRLRRSITGQDFSLHVDDAQHGARCSVDRSHFHRLQNAIHRGHRQSKRCSSSQKTRKWLAVFIFRLTVCDPPPVTGNFG